MVGPGLILGTDVVDVVDIRPGSLAYITHDGPTFHPQNEEYGGNIAFYEIHSDKDIIDIKLDRFVIDFDNPSVSFMTIWGPTDFDVYDRVYDVAIVSEKSGFNSDEWIVDISNTSQEFRLTNFDTTQAAFYPYVAIFDNIV